MSKITELNTTDTYRLVDVEGYKADDPVNKGNIDKCKEILTGFKLDRIVGSCGIIKDIFVLDAPEYKFFEKVDIETVKPEVDYYVQTEHRGKPYEDMYKLSPTEAIHTALDDIIMQEDDGIQNLIKSKFRPVYK